MSENETVTLKARKAPKVDESLEKAVDPAVPVTRDSGIVVADPLILRPKVLPLVVTLPPGASKAQIERAKVLNGYAYSHPYKWNQRKEKLLEELEALKDAPDPDTSTNGKAIVGASVPGALAA